MLLHKLALPSLLLLSLAVAGCDGCNEKSFSGQITMSLGSGVVGSGKVKSETREVHGFTRIALSTSGDVKLSQTGTESLTIEADDNLLPILTSKVEAGELLLSNDGTIQPTKPIHYTLTVKDLTGIRLTGSGDLQTTPITADQLTVKVTGSGDVKVAGTANRVEATVTGSGDFDGSNLRTKAVDVTVTGSGNAAVNATDSLEARVMGSGDVSYLGNPPKVVQKVTGSGSIHKR